MRRKACHLPRNLYHFADQQRRFYKAIHALLHESIFRISRPFRGSARAFSKLNDRSEGLQGLFFKFDDHSEGLQGLFFKFDDHLEGLRGLFSKLDDHSEGLQGTFTSRIFPFGGQNKLLPLAKRLWARQIIHYLVHNVFGRARSGFTFLQQVFGHAESPLHRCKMASGTPEYVLRHFSIEKYWDSPRLP